MKSKLYQYRNVTFTFNPAYRKWAFTVNDKNHTVLQECPGGAVTAEKVARQVAGGFARAGQLDGIALSAIRKLTHPQIES